MVITLQTKLLRLYTRLQIIVIIMALGRMDTLTDYRKHSSSLTKLIVNKLTHKNFLTR